MPDISLEVVDGLTLSQEYRDVLRPGELLPDADGKLRRLPRFFYKVDSWQQAREVQLAPCFGLYEFINIDVREATILRGWPRYVPCAVSLLAMALNSFRSRVGTYVHIACNGGYRSPGHELSRNATLHHWGTAVNIYRVGDDFIDTEEEVNRYAEIARDTMPGCWIRPFGHDVGLADDHLHVDLGYATLIPHNADGEQATEEDK